jgi:acyl dehydratase
MTLQVGQEIDPFVVEKVDFERMKTMVAILQDPNPIHFDEEVVSSLGLGGFVNQGPINLTWLIESVCRFVGGPAALRGIQIRFLGNVFAGERYECSGTVTEVDGDTAKIEVSATANGRPALAGIATVRVSAA